MPVCADEPGLLPIAGNPTRSAACWHVDDDRKDEPR
jgi:hypothetical protein